jgi:hypothetical protein
MNDDGQVPAAGSPPPEGALRAAFTELRVPAATRARHLHALRHRAASMPAPEPGRAPQAGRRGFRVRALAVLTAVMLALGAGTAIAARDALPGDRLYGAKLALEQVSLRLPVGPAARVERSLELADRRLAEVEALRGSRDGGLVAEGLARHNHRLAEADRLAGDGAELNAQVDAALLRALERITQLLDEDDLPDDAADQAREALEVVRERLEDLLERSPGPPAEPGRSNEQRPGTQSNRTDPDARPGGGTPPPSPGDRAPRS